MQITIKRIALKDKYTIGRLYINEEYLCDTLEDKVRDLPNEKKVMHETAIPKGTYGVTLKVQSGTFSKKKYYKDFCDGYLPRLVDVPYFSGILIHRGTNASHSSGCILVGYNTIVGQLTNSQQAFEKVYNTLKIADSNNEPITISIQ